MSAELTITVEAKDAAVCELIRAELSAFNRAAVNKPDRQHFNVVLRDAHGRVHGGLLASVNFDVLVIEDLFLEENCRRDGFGSRLMARAEEEAMRRGARTACVTTFSWQARPFYEKHGYTVFGELPYQGGAHRLFWLKKPLCE
jgi:GNAT superfamily N-acetyltransferase